MIHSLLGVCLICMGVGAKPTPITSYRHTENNEISLKQNAHENQIEYGVYLPYNGTQTYQYENATIDPGNASIDPNATYLLSETKYKFNSSTAPYIVEGATQENRYVEKYTPVPSTDIYYLSSANFYDQWKYSATAMKITTQVVTAEADIEIFRDVMVAFYNKSNETITKTIEIETYGYIGYEENHRNIYNKIVNDSYSVNQSYNDIQNNPQGFTPIINTYTYYLNIAPQTTIIMAPEIRNTYHPNIVANAETYIIEFTKMAIVNSNPFTFKDTNISMTWTNYDENDIPESPYGQRDNISMLKYLIDNRNETNNVLHTYYVSATIVQEVVDIPGIMWEILAMPFAFISTAFNLTLFPGTAYSINISNLVLMVFGVLVFLFIFKLILRK